MGRRNRGNSRWLGGNCYRTCIFGVSADANAHSGPLALTDSPNYWVEVNGVKQARFVIYGGGMSDTKSNAAETTFVKDGNWHHIAFVKSGITLTTFINGQPYEMNQGSQRTVAAMNPFTTAGHMYIGSSGDPGLVAERSHSFNGYMDEVRVWSAARTQSEIE
eukprot:369465_1